MGNEYPVGSNRPCVWVYVLYTGYDVLSIRGLCCLYNVDAHSLPSWTELQQHGGTARCDTETTASHVTGRRFAVRIGHRILIFEYWLAVIT